MDSKSYHQLWQRVLGDVELSVSRGMFMTWYKNTSLLSLNKDGVAEVAVPNIFVKQQFETRFTPQLKDSFNKNDIKIKKIIYRIDSASNSTKSTPTQSLRDAVAEIPTKRPIKSVRKTPATSLNPKYTFESFIVGSSNELAYTACQAVSKMPGTKYNPLFIYGGVGLGKTHLIQAVGNKIMSTSPETSVLYLSSETFVNDFIDSIQYKKKGFADKYRNVDVLIVDDMQFIAGKEQTQEAFFHTFNSLHQANKQIIIGSDKPPKSIPTLTERLRSRFEWGMTVDIQMPDFETRCAIIEAKTSQSGTTLPRETTEYLAGQIKTNIRELEGALNQLLATVELRGLEPTIETASTLLGSVKQSRPSYLTARHIIEKVAKYSQVDVDDLLSPKRDKHIVIPRQIAMYLLRSELHLSFPKIAAELGRKDHTTAIHSVEKISKEVKLDFMIREHVSAIREILYA